MSGQGASIAAQLDREIGYLGKRPTDVAIIIVSWNTRDLLRDCLNSIFIETHEVSFEIIVVDNNSVDGTGAMVCSEFPFVKLIENRDNRGFAAACNQGIRAALARYILLLNPDTIVLEEAIDRCVQYADCHPDVGVVGCQVLDDDDRIFSFPTRSDLFSELFGLYKLFPGSRLFGRGRLDWAQCDKERDVDVIAGMFMLVRRTAIEEIGLMDEAFFLYYEETDWCYRLARFGWRRVFLPFAWIRHREGGGKSAAQISRRMYVQKQKSALVYFRKNEGVGSWILVKGMYIASSVFRALYWLALWIINGEVRAQEKCSKAWAAVVYHTVGIAPNI